MNGSGFLGLFLAIPPVVSMVYDGIAALLLGRWLRATNDEEPAPDSSLPPVTFFRPLKAGVPNLRDKLEVLASAMRAGDQLLIGVEMESAEQAAAEEVQSSHPGKEIVVVACAPAGLKNPKIAKVLQMEPAARHEHWILSDSEAVLDAAFLDAFRREWTRCDVLTAGYRFSRVRNWPQRLDAAATLLTLWPGLAVLRNFPVRLTLGACSGFRRKDIAAAGGWKAFENDLAEDNRLGKALADAGRTIRLSRQVVTLESDALSWRDYWRHQRRVAVTYRVSSPAGFAGAIFSQGVTAGLLLVCWQPAAFSSWAFFVGAFAARCVAARYLTRILSFPISHLGPVVLVASVVETGCWVLSWGTRSVWWAGRRRRISRDGRLLGLGKT